MSLLNNDVCTDSCIGGEYTSIRGWGGHAWPCALKFFVDSGKSLFTSWPLPPSIVFFTSEYICSGANNLFDNAIAGYSEHTSLKFSSGCLLLYIKPTEWSIDHAFVTHAVCSYVHSPSHWFIKIIAS